MPEITFLFFETSQGLFKLPFFRVNTLHLYCISRLTFHSWSFNDYVITSDIALCNFEQNR